MRIVIAGGGTAGHISPSIAVADRLREGGATVEFVGSPTGQEASIVPAAGYRFHAVAATPFRRELSLRSAAAPFVALRSVATSRPIVRDAAAVLGMGGYASIAAVVAARSVEVPVVLHEQNAVPGLANRLLARLATAMALTFEDSRARLPRSLRAEVTGLPLRREIREVLTRRDELAEEARRSWDLEAARTTLLVTGGSQGALHVDRTVAEAIPLLASRSDLQLVVLTGAAHEPVVAAAVGREMELIVRTVPFLERMELALAVADLAVARAGANTIHELAACAIPSILIPYPHATDDHQAANASALERAGAAEVYADRDLTPEGLARRILSLVGDGERRTVMAKAGAAWARPDADEHVAELVREVARR
ncbi:MAG TPA: undecaprenyldiphospho-muramoylpentapeptide beta-N-acetylglucosaminyltransferase [Actinomycetota bacterium]|nr:undecaprenyldiphospho-muramoylpentapeptide beta-N-acetylglucosaminyltransferase [Actinomycetota bacterium]